MYRSSAFWKTKLEESKIPCGFGFGDRGKGLADKSPWKLDPCTYGDLGPILHLIRDGASVGKNITLKPRFVRPEGISHTPGPKYDVSNKQCGPVFSINGRPRANMDVTPGPGQYETRRKPGRNYPIAHGTLYDIVLQGRTKPPDPIKKNPGPGTYMPPCFTDKYNVAPIPPPKDKKRKKHQVPGTLGGTMDDLMGGGSLVQKNMGESTVLLAELQSSQSAPELPGAVVEPWSAPE